MKSDVSAAANPCRRLFQMEVEARITAAAVKVSIFSNDVTMYMLCSFQMRD